MKLQYKLIFTALIIAVNLTSSFAGDGVMIKSKTTDLTTNTVSSSEVYISESKMIIKNSSDNNRILFDANTEVFSYVDDRKKEYYQFDKATLIQLKQQIQVFAQMMKQFASQMPEEQRKKLDKFMNMDGGSPIEYKQISGVEKIKSWNTSKYEGYDSNTKIMTMNIATYQGIGIESSKFNAMKKMLDFAKENLQEIAGMLPTGGSLSQVGFDENSPILRDGIPVKTIVYKNGVPENENAVESVTLISIADSQFDIPAGYVRKTIDIQNQLGGR